MHVTVSWANVEEPRAFDWSPTKLVGVAAVEAGVALGVTGAVRLSLDGLILGDMDPLCVAGVVEGSELEIVPIGTAV